MMRSDLTHDERRQLGMAALTAAVVTLAAGLVNLCLEETKRLLAERRRSIENCTIQQGVANVS